MKIYKMGLTVRPRFAIIKEKGGMAMAKLSRISMLHYYKLVGRSLMLISALILYIIGRARGDERPFQFLAGMPWLLLGIFVIFTVEMLLRFFPSRLESMGCQKQFRRNYIPKEANTEGRVHLGTWRSTLAVAAAWVALNAVFAVLYYTGVLDAAILLLISLFYSVADMICILFFCPFQTWFMKNKCCGCCRIYNWDYAMMFTPLVFLGNGFGIALFGLAFLLLLFWEIAVFRHPERFSPATNAALSCVNCPEKLCQHKRQLRAFIKKNATRIHLAETIAPIVAKAKRIIKRDK